jgi:hypothetical protein
MAQRYSSSWTGEVLQLWEHLDCKHTSKECQFQEWVLDIGGFNNLQVFICALDSIGCFHPFVDTLFRGSWRSGLGHLMKNY